ncbi:MAG: Zn-dependent alcohol dehydrogenase [Polyangiaceae bacterium]|nr:Zn-dependent alcohol dehydrogenase [Polyangiaceae bacterium]
MKAALFTAVNEKLVVKDGVTLGELGPKDVHVKIKAAGICHSDLSIINGKIPGITNSVMGHEGAGIVLAVGKDVTRVKVDDHIVIAWGPPCGACFHCGVREPQLCEKGMQQTRTPHFQLDGNMIMSSIGTATMCEETIIPEISAIKILKDVPFEVAALVGCGVTTGVGAALNSAEVRPGSSVVVFGCGGVGIAAIQGCKVAGASEIVGVDPFETRQAWAKEFGATHACSPKDLGALQSKLTRNRGFDYAFEVVGKSETIRAAWDATRRGGTVTVLGVTAMDDTVQFGGVELFYSEKTLRGSMYGSSDVRVDFNRYLGLWRNGRLDLDGMITKRFKLEEVNEAFDALRDGSVVRSVITFD